MSLAYFPLYPDDFEADTAHLSLAEDGAFNRLLRLCWRTPGCSVPADREWIYRRLRARTDDERAVVDVVIDEFFVTKNGRLSNARLTKEWLAANEAHERRKNAGSKGGRSKALKTKDQKPSNARAKLKQPEPEPEPLEEEPKGSRARKRATRLSEDWVCPEEWIDEAVAAGLGSHEARQLAEQMRDWSLSSPKGAKLDWRATWRGFVRRELADRGKPSGGGGGGNHADRQRASADAHQSASVRVAARLMGYGDDGGPGGHGGGEPSALRVVDGGAPGSGFGFDRTVGEALSAPSPKRARG